VAATRSIIDAMRVLRVVRVVAELIVVTLALWLVPVVGIAYYLWSSRAHLDGIVLLIVAGLVLWWAFRRAVLIVAWIERRFWAAPPSDLEQPAVRRLVVTAVIFACLMLVAYWP
jgi:hypothetical protein